MRETLKLGAKRHAEVLLESEVELEDESVVWPTVDGLNSRGSSKAASETSISQCQSLEI